MQYRIPISCVHIDIDLIFKVFKIDSADLQDFSARVFSNNLNTFDVQHFEVSNMICFKNVLGFVLVLFRMMQWSQR